MSTLRDRIIQALEHRKAIADRGERITMAALARASGVKAPSVADWFNGKTQSLKGEPLLGAAAYLRVRPEWLGSGKGPMVPASPAHVSSASNATILGPLRPGARIPVVGTAQLGDNGHFVELEYPPGHGDGYIDLPTRDPNAYAVRCRGDSMSPRIQHGEYVVVEPGTEVKSGDEVLVKATDGRVMVKKFLYRRDGRVHLVSVNEAHPSIAIDESMVESMHYVAATAKSSRYVIE